MIQPSGTYERVVASEPINRQAASVMQSGYQYTAPGEGVEWFRDCPALRTVTQAMRYVPSFCDYTGYKVGRYTVIGVGIPKARANWVARCSCGRFAYITARTIRNAKDHPDCCCAVCSDVWKMREGRIPQLHKSADGNLLTAKCSVCRRPCKAISLYCNPRCRARAKKQRQEAARA